MIKNKSVLAVSFLALSSAALFVTSPALAGDQGSTTGGGDGSNCVPCDGQECHLKCDRADYSIACDAMVHASCDAQCDVSADIGCVAGCTAGCSLDCLLGA